MSDSTFSNSDYKKLNQDEKSLSKLLSEDKQQEGVFKPSKRSIQSILAYSKALSIRKSQQISFIENLLN